MTDERDPAIPPLEPDAVAPPEPAPPTPVWSLPPPAPSPDALPEPPIAADAAMRTLPGARSLVAAGFDLLRDARRDLTRASLYFGLLALLTIGPAIVLLIYFVTQEPDLFTDYFDLASTDVPPPPPTGLVMVILALLCAFPALMAISIEAPLMAVGILAGHRIRHPVSMDEALRRSRQSFWRTLLSSLVIGGLSFGILIAFEEVLGPEVLTSTELSTTLSVLLGLAFGLPFAYAVTGIVLGDAGPIQTLGRSLRLARARPMLALVIALFATLVGVINTFALGAGGDTLVRIAQFLHLDFQSGPFLTILSVTLILAGVVAIGSLLFTISAVTAAPQVVAFLGLTHFSRGLDEARLVPRPSQSRATPVVEAISETPAEPSADQPTESGAEPSAAEPLTEPLTAAEPPGTGPPSEPPTPLAPPAPPAPTINAWERAATADAAKAASTAPALVSWPMFIFAVLSGVCVVLGFANLAGF